MSTAAGFGIGEALKVFGENLISYGNREDQQAHEKASEERRQQHDREMVTHKIEQEEKARVDREKQTAEDLQKILYMNDDQKKAYAKMGGQDAASKYGPMTQTSETAKLETTSVDDPGMSMEFGQIMDTGEKQTTFGDTASIVEQQVYDAVKDENIFDTDLFTYDKDLGYEFSMQKGMAKAATMGASSDAIDRMLQVSGELAKSANIRSKQLIAQQKLDQKEDHFKRQHEFDMKKLDRQQMMQVVDSIVDGYFHVIANQTGAYEQFQQQALAILKGERDQVSGIQKRYKLLGNATGDRGLATTWLREAKARGPVLDPLKEYTDEEVETLITAMETKESWDIFNKNAENKEKGMKMLNLIYGDYTRRINKLSERGLQEGPGGSMSTFAAGPAQDVINLLQSFRMADAVNLTVGGFRAGRLSGAAGAKKDSIIKVETSKARAYLDNPKISNEDKLGFVSFLKTTDPDFFGVLVNEGIISP